MGKVAVKNRSSRTIIYTLPELGVRREFAPGEVKQIPIEELDALSYRPGGARLMQDNLFIQDKQVIKSVGIHVEPEYYLDEQGVKDLINTGSIDSFLDCLDFAPDGVIDLIKKYAYELPCNDARKREALKNKTGFDVTLALQHKAEVEAAQREEREETSNGMTVAATPTRRVKQTTNQQSGRRTTPQYKVVNKKGE